MVFVDCWITLSQKVCEMVFGYSWIILSQKVCQIWYLGTVGYSWIQLKKFAKFGIWGLLYILGLIVIVMTLNGHVSSLFFHSCGHRSHNNKKYCSVSPKETHQHYTTCTPQHPIKRHQNSPRSIFISFLPMSSSSRAFFIKVTTKNSSMLKFFSLARLDLQIYPRKAELCVK